MNVSDEQISDLILAIVRSDSGWEPAGESARTWLAPILEQHTAQLRAENAELKEDAEMFRWLTEDIADSDERARRNEIFDRMAVRSYSATKTAIAAARRTGDKP